MGLRVKICGITKPEQGRTIAQLGATALGFICAPASPRHASPDQIAAIVTALPLAASGVPCVDRIGVFVNASLEVICQTVAIGQLNGVQLHGDESAEFCDRLRQRLPAIELIKALRISTAEALLQANAYAAWVDTLLLDAYDPKLPGGTGKTLDWSSLSQFRPACPWFLAGGLTPDNILDALCQTQPHGIDLSSGVEYAPGDKNLLEVTRLFSQLETLQQPSAKPL
ncbi:phosphoribosylanthranilate isomerase [Stenomitos frigidus]|uniref:N-(5'-phosphoribosyl)anthranilate isomerase n=1 Tax=Stenomitos frigidus ULC18 TaxID=2107698 RepID=A0A2T1EPJ8_9CYAN|nr:phosphoribosylanthranilate isomerase [Stenomitos frigidus]PSB34654.1 phosphoribosylanthranilate isomerase [Stenomitos frigidus ULC18]